ncbi:MFS transporter [Saccharopolyspora cebuensis]|uniref:Sugar MFS transporter n=1 Tax=Saccharopolyspora cebuensis TaxID=418759 RepID=A0ABV4CGH0_9PSEU
MSALDDRTFALGVPLYFLVGTGHVLWGAMTPMLQRDLGVSSQSLSWLVTVQFLAFLVAVLCSPHVVSRWGLRTSVTAALASIVAGVVLLGQAAGSGELLASGLLFGLGAGFLESSVGGYALTAPGAHRKIAVLESCFALGALGLPLLVFLLSEQVSRAELCLGFAVAVTSCLVAWCLSWNRLDEGPPVRRAGTTGGAGPSYSLGLPVLLALGFFYAGAETNIAAFLPSVTSDSHGATAGVLAVSGFWAAVAAGRWAWSVYGTSAFSAPAIVVMTSGMVIALVAMSVTLGSSVVLLVFLAALCGLAAAGVFPVAVALAVRTSELPGATVTSLFIGAACFGGSLLAVPVGLAIHHLGTRSGVVVLCLYATAACLASLAATKHVTTGHRAAVR